ncbi:hypothetical protein A374_18199 [Fictibacillus macauensis ZFHKF-1]|uniref:Uncharacterized protein n=1 Tax=Fictibacillus macauensis ZFHKF-1 TaxID=1196324 RepID=I8UB42_9BACL|nr:hypothetical protein [Fictibacillus macauensis]EIT83993.1 hypothetical protein A374_18199 [Fictibacillus macauensis ZFHKF-1]
MKFEGTKGTIDVSGVSSSFATLEEADRFSKKLKGIYIDQDVLQVYEREAAKRKRGWGSQLVSDLLRTAFEQQGLLGKKKL